jgi:8-oxo-dGTP pyrophosphatase MutT (NUDIX family)
VRAPEACDTLVAALRAYAQRATPKQVTQAQRIIEFVQTHEAPWRRSTIEGHLTASAWIVDEAQTHALLVHHKKLDQWLQPGGHIDDDDLRVFDAARREAHEETGIGDFAIESVSTPPIFDVDVHEIPARGEEPAHFHYDIRYRFTALNRATTLNAAEANTLRWFPITQIAADETIDESVRRMALIFSASSRASLQKTISALHKQ